MSTASAEGGADSESDREHDLILLLEGVRLLNSEEVDFGIMHFEAAHDAAIQIFVREQPDHGVAVFGFRAAHLASRRSRRPWDGHRLSISSRFASDFIWRAARYSAASSRWCRYQAIAE